METTKLLFEERKNEVTHYYEVLCDLEINPPCDSKANDTIFFKILKSNMLVMLYNLVEASIVSGITEIYNLIKSENLTYKKLSSQIKDLWISEQTFHFADPSFNRNTYREKVTEIVNDIVDGATVFLSSDSIKRDGGNFDDKIIKRLCDKHGIRYSASDDKGNLSKVKSCRNQLAHGVDSFSNYACDITISDLQHIMEGVVNFITGILNGMDDYYKNKLFLAR